MSSLNLDFYINKHRKAYEERLKKEQSNQENLKDTETKNDRTTEEPKQVDEVTEPAKLDETKQEHQNDDPSNPDNQLDQIDADYLYALKLDEALNGPGESSINPPSDQTVNNINKSNSDEKNKENDIRSPDDFYVECLLDGNDAHSYYMDYNYNNSNDNFNHFNNNTTVRQYNTRSSRYNTNGINNFSSSWRQYRDGNGEHNKLFTSSDEDITMQNGSKNGSKNGNDGDLFYITDDNTPLSSTPRQNNIKKKVNIKSGERKNNGDVIYIGESAYNGDRDKTYPTQNRKRKDNEGDDEYSYKNIKINENDRKKKSQKKNIYEIDNEYFDIKQDGNNEEGKNDFNDNLIKKSMNNNDNINNSFEYISSVYNLNEKKYENLSEKKPKKSSKRESPDTLSSCYDSSSIYSFRSSKNKKTDKNANAGNYYLNETQDISNREYNGNVENGEKNKTCYEQSLSKNINDSNKYKDKYDFHKFANNNLSDHYLTEKDFSYNANENHLDKSIYNEDKDNKLLNKNKNEKNKKYDFYNNKLVDNNTSNIKDNHKNRNYKNNSESCETQFIKDINFDYSFSSNKNDDVLIFNNNTNEHNNNEDAYKYYIS
ncbi:hypothetical protein YYG_02783 [Plasmodium vinckei petteri]|uniref:Uncharacterized protein n=1 Tax=Plasmodium vinckei petteri TaxID=138298 RepID=W7AFD6_PLAVN|nr:hypothetical protein YYG_02783 [Plasmodium vinckei petteri]CAD2103116.1 conserved Plasmodium protein, unknown function [Plasmodium vinckei petteri]